MMKSVTPYSLMPIGIAAAVCIVIAGMSLFLHMPRANAADTHSSGERLVTIHDRGEEKVILTHAQSIKTALKEAGVVLDANDAVEPKRDEALIDSSYNVKIYRARPVIVADGAIRQKIMTPYQTVEKIAGSAGLALRDEDTAILRPTEDIVTEGAGLELKIDRAIPFTFVLYGKKTDAFTRADTVSEMLKQKGIELSENDHVSVALDTKITSGVTVELSRDGKQTVTEEQAIPFTIEKTYDTARPVGYREVQTPGLAGKRTVIFEVEMKSGKEIGRKEIQNVVTQESKKQIEVIGLNPGNGLSRSKGANMFTDSKGTVHRETYYDLAMNVVMKSCGAGGNYTVRPDGAKIDKDGYILIAANLARYPRCSLVETSLGTGKVYDTGGFAAKHPDGFDLATDWSNNDNR
ncbi:DUF348 domain-containing protein [Candidatus Saccharibacteria bacterium]|nr:DUF348 domain-containing protein [Candidatus Saccharibacteria bacterium]